MVTDPLEIGIEPACVGDAPMLAALHGSAFPRPWNRPSFEGFIADTACITLVARDVQSETVGFVTSRLAAGEAEILTIAVRLERRRAGIGTALLQELMRRLADHGAAALFLEVGQDNKAACALYERFGFRQVGRRADYYRSSTGAPRRDALVLRRSLAL